MKYVILILLAIGGVASADDLAAKKQTCVDAMNADPAFAKSIAATFDRQIDAEIVNVHKAAQEHVHTNEQHVIYAYIAMWVIAVGFVVFLWRRQVALRGEIDRLRDELAKAELPQASAKETK